MSNEIIIAKLEEVLTSTYFRSGDETVDAISQCDLLGEEFEIIEFSEKEFYLRILQHLRYFFNAEFMYLSKKVEKGLKSYQKLITAIGETLAEFPNLYSRWQYDIDRLLLRIDARIQDSKAQIAQTQDNLVEADLLYTETINRYNNELEFEQSNNDYDHYFNSLGNIFQVTGFLYHLRGRKTNNRKDLYEALKNLKKAKFLGQPNLSSKLEEIRNDTISLILTNLEIQAEKFFNRGLLESEKERFTDAKISYQKSAQIFRSLNHIQPSIEYELQEQIQISSYYEAFAKSLMINDANEKASLIFSQANRTLQMVLQKISSDALRQNFEPQMIYFQAMQLFCQAVTEYDKLIETAPTHFNEAKTMLEEAKAKAEELDNLPLAKNCQDILNKLKSYLEIADMMFQEEGIVQEDLNLTPTTPEPTIEPTPEPIIEPTPEPIIEPTPEPIIEPTPEPTIEKEKEKRKDIEISESYTDKFESMEEE